MERKPQDIVVEYFLEHPTATNIEISEHTGVSKSSVQRYLSNPDIGNINIPTTGKTIAEQIRLNTLKGRQKGGRNTFQHYAVVRGEKGKFNGIVQESSQEEIDKEKQKREDIRNIVVYFSRHPFLTMEELAQEISHVPIRNTKTTYTPDYVYRCLNDPRVEEMFGSVIANAITERLDQNRYGILEKFEGIWNPESFTDAGLTAHEQSVLLDRFPGDGTISSAEHTAHKFGISKTMVTKIENQALEKLKKYQKSMGEND